VIAVYFGKKMIDMHQMCVSLITSNDVGHSAANSAPVRTVRLGADLSRHQQPEYAQVAETPFRVSGWQSKPLVEPLTGTMQ